MCDLGPTEMFNYDCVCVFIEHPECVYKEWDIHSNKTVMTIIFKSMNPSNPWILLSLQSQWGHPQAAAPGRGPGRKPVSPPGTASHHGENQTGYYPSEWHFVSRLAVAQRQGNPGKKDKKSQEKSSLLLHCYLAPCHGSSIHTGFHSSQTLQQSEVEKKINEHAFYRKG